MPSPSSSSSSICRSTNSLPKSTSDKKTQGTLKLLLWWQNGREVNPLYVAFRCSPVILLESIFSFLTVGLFDFASGNTEREDLPPFYFAITARNSRVPCSFLLEVVFGKLLVDLKFGRTQWWWQWHAWSDMKLLFFPFLSPFFFLFFPSFFFSFSFSFFYYELNYHETFAAQRGLKKILVAVLSALAKFAGTWCCPLWWCSLTGYCQVCLRVFCGLELQLRVCGQWWPLGVWFYRLCHGYFVASRLQLRAWGQW